MAYIIGIFAVLLYFLISFVVVFLAKRSTKQSRAELDYADGALQIIEGQEGRISLAKWQWFFWTAVIVFSYVAIMSSRMLAGYWETGDIGFPSNLWLVMGYSTITVLAAQRMDRPNEEESDANGKAVEVKPEQGEGDLSRVSNLVFDKQGKFDLSRIQLIIWTVISIGIFTAMVVNQVNNGSPAVLPDIDLALMALMGLSSAGYLGKKKWVGP